VVKALLQAIKKERGEEIKGVLSTDGPREKNLRGKPSINDTQQAGNGETLFLCWGWRRNIKIRQNKKVVQLKTPAIKREVQGCRGSS